MVELRSVPNNSPEPPTDAVRRRMVAQLRTGTKPEILLRKLLFADGFRYRVNYKVPGAPRRTIDIAFPGKRVAVFVDGCFWHGCPEHASWPKSNAQFWRDKIEANRARDADTDRRLSASGWRVIRVWAHERVGEAAERIENVVRGGGGLQ